MNEIETHPDQAESKQTVRSKVAQKRPYQLPVLTAFGSVALITGSAGGSQVDGMNPFQGGMMG